MEPVVIRDPPIPHVGPIDGNFTPGKMVRVQGSTFPSSQRFAINLQCGPNIMPRDDIALHISVRIPEHYIARNSLEDGQWGTEQSEGSNPIGPGHQFEILILCDSNKYKIAVNGQHFAEFPQRLPVRRVSHISIDGDVNIALISVEGGIPLSGGDGDEEHARGFTPTPAHGPPPAATHGSPIGPPPGAYGPPPGAYAPPPGAYGPPPGAYGPPQHGYGRPGGPPAPPGHQTGQQDSGVGDFLGSAGSFLSSALGKGGLLESLTGGNKPPQQPQQPAYQQQPSQPNFFGGGYPGHGGPGGQQQGQFGGLGQLGSMLASQLANNILNPQQKKPT